MVEGRPIRSLKDALPSYAVATQEFLADPSIRRSEVPEHRLEDYDGFRAVDKMLAEGQISPDEYPKRIRHVMEENLVREHGPEAASWVEILPPIPQNPTR